MIKEYFLLIFDNKTKMHLNQNLSQNKTISNQTQNLIIQNLNQNSNPKDKSKPKHTHTHTHTHTA
jgi:hypothetical protein